MEKKELAAEEFLKKKFNLSEACGGCRFFKILTGDCVKKNISVNYETPKCDNWRYFA